METVSDLSLDLSSVDVHLIEKASHGGEEIGAEGEDRENQAVSKRVAR